MAPTYSYGSKGPIQPFWERIHRFFLLPLDSAVLLRMAGLSAAFVASFALLFLGGFGFVLMLPAMLAILVVGARYGFKIIERTSKGFLRPSEYPLTDEDLVSKYLPYKFVAINIAFGILAALLVGLTGGNEFVALVAWLFFFVGVLPAATMRLVITGSLRGAMNPAEMVALVKRIGQPYAALAAFVFMGDLSRTYGMAALAAFGGVTAGALGMGGGKAGLGFGAVVMLFLVSVGFWYFTYMICALIGYTMYQYADRLDISVMGPGERSLRSVATARTVDVKARRRDAMIGQLVTSGDVRDAIKLLQQDLQDRPNDLSLNARLHKLVIAEGSGLRIDDQTDKYLNLLVKSQNWSEALQLYQEGVARRPDWSPREGATVAALAQAALRAGKPQIAGALIKGFDKRFLNHPDIPKVYLVGAQLMAEFAGKPDEARRILQYLLQKYPTDAVSTEATRYLELMNRMAATAH
jgi:tetratricopeptide (TPR) repeat protein